MSLQDKFSLAHNFCTANVENLKKSKKCGCFFCLSVFKPKEIIAFLSDGTALCPHCGVDSVIGDAFGFDISEDFLNKMKKYWF